MENLQSGIVPPDSSAKAEMRAAFIALGVSIALLLVKFTAYFLTRSNAVLSDALETIANVVASSFALYSVRTAHLPADMEHPYGHGKIEFFSAGLEGSMILLAALLIVGKVGSSFLYHERSLDEHLEIGLFLMGTALGINAILGIYLRVSGRKNKSLTLEASGTHLLVDAVDSVAVVIALALVRWTGQLWIDNAAALLVAAYIVFQGLRLIKRSAAGLMDEQDAEDRTLLQSILDTHIGPHGKEPRICSYHKLRHRHTGRYHWVDFHLVVPAWWDIDKGHRLASAIEYEIELALGEGNATAHVEPCIQPACPMCHEARALKAR